MDITYKYEVVHVDRNNLQELLNDYGKDGYHLEYMEADGVNRYMIVIAKALNNTLMLD